MIRLLIALLFVPAAVGCGTGGETALSKEEKSRFGGTKPPDEVLKRLQGKTPPPSQAPR